MKYIIFEKEGENKFHAYTFNVAEDKDETVYTLDRSNDSRRNDHVRGTNCCKVKDTGDDMIFCTATTKRKLDYSTAAELRLMLNCIDAYERECNKTKIFEEYEMVEEKIIAKL